MNPTHVPGQEIYLEVLLKEIKVLTLNNMPDRRSFRSLVCALAVYPQLYLSGCKETLHRLPIWVTVESGTFLLDAWKVIKIYSRNTFLQSVLFFALPLITLYST